MIGGVEVTRRYRISTPESTFEVSLSVRSSEGAEGKRSWFVGSPMPDYSKPPQWTELGHSLQTLRGLAAKHVETWAKTNAAKSLDFEPLDKTPDWQRAVLRSGVQRSLQGGLTGSSPDTRYALSGNYFGQQGVIPGQGYTRGAAFASVDHTSSRLRLGVSANTSRINTDMGEGGAAYGYALAMTPLGQPYNFTNPDSAGLLDPRPDDDPLNINPVLEAQSAIRQQTVNRVFG